MSSTDSTVENTTAEVHDTSTKIKSPIIAQTIRIAFYITSIVGVIAGIQLFFASIDYYSAKALDVFGDSALATLYPWLLTVTRAGLQIVFVALAVIIFRSKHDDRMSVFTAFFLLTFGIGGLWFVQYTTDPTYYIEVYNLQIAFALSGLGWTLLMTFIYIFPDGRFVPSWMFLPMGLSFVFVALWSLPSSSELYPGNWDGLLLGATVGPGFLVPIIAQIYRYRRVSTLTQRQQTKWVVFGMIVSFVLLVGTSVIYASLDRSSINYDLMTLLSDSFAIVIPISLAFAMLRSRLWDIDLIINRSLVYGIVAAVDLTFLFGAIVGLQLVFGQTEPIVAIIIALVLSVAIYRPLSHISRQIIDRHVYHLRFQVDDLHKAHKKQKIINAGDLSGRKLGKYEVLDVIGRGGMGEVYKADGNGKAVAIKTLLKDKADDPELITRFQREADAGQTLQHPNIAHVYDIGVDGDTIYMVMDYLEGRDLSSWLKEHGSVDLPMAQDIVRDLTGALDYAHAKGFVHRDIKPSNIMLVPNNDNETYRAVLMDFGITKIKDANTLTGTGAVGTIDYMAPEQIMDAKTVDHRADIYALGIVMYEMLVGQRPFSGGPGQVLFAHLQQPAPDPRDTMPDLPRPIAKHIMKALEKSPEDRFDSAVEIMRAFDKVAV